MPSKQAQKAVTAKMYRHFAVVTLFVTACLAIATSEDGASAFNDAVDRQEVQASSADGGRVAKGDPPPAASGWAPDHAVEFDDNGMEGSSGIVPAELRGGSAAMARQLGLTEEQFAALSEEQKKRLLEGLAANTADRDQQYSASRASLNRSGGDGDNCEDC